jgi:hypothetical protein
MSAPQPTGSISNYPYTGGNIVNFTARAWEETQECVPSIRNVPNTQSQYLDTDTYLLKTREILFTVRLTDAEKDTLMNIFNLNSKIIITMNQADGGTGHSTYTGYLEEPDIDFEYRKEDGQEIRWWKIELTVRCDVLTATASTSIEFDTSGDVSVGGIYFNYVTKFERSKTSNVQLPEWLDQAAIINYGFFNNQLITLTYEVRASDLTKLYLDQLFLNHTRVVLTDDINNINTSVFVQELDESWTADNFKRPWLITLSIITDNIYPFYGFEPNIFEAPSSTSETTFFQKNFVPESGAIYPITLPAPLMINAPLGITFQEYDPVNHPEIYAISDWNNLIQNLNAIIDFANQKIYPSSFNLTSVESSINPSIDITYGLGDPSHRWLGAVIKTIYTDKIDFPSNAATDTNLYRSATGMLKTDNSFTIVGDLYVNGTINGTNAGGGGSGSSATNFEVTNLLTIDNLITLKDTGDVLITSLINTGGIPTNVASPSGNYLDIFCTMISPQDHVTPLTDPMLTINQAMLLEKDFQGHGFLGTSSDPFKGMGGGAILMGQGFTGLYCPPVFSLTGTMIGMSINDYPHGTSFPSHSAGQLFGITTTNTLYRDDGSNWIELGTCSTIGTYPTYTSTTLPSGSSMQWAYASDNHTLYQYYSGSWAPMFNNVPDAYYDTLFLIRADTEGLANLFVNNLGLNTIFSASNITQSVTLASIPNTNSAISTVLQFANGNYRLYLNSDNSVHFQTPSNSGLVVEQNLWANNLVVNTNLALGNGTASISFSSGITNGIRYLMVDGSNETVGIGSQNHYLKFIDASDIFCNNLMTLDNAWINVNAPLSFIDGNVDIVRQTTGTQANKDTLRIQTPSDGGLIVEQNFWANNAVINTNFALGNGTASISFSAGITTGIRYLMVDGSNETVGIGSQGHYLKFIDSADVFCNRLMNLDNAYINVNAPLVFIDSTITLYKNADGSMHLQTPSNSGLVVEQNLWANNFVCSINFGLGLSTAAVTLTEGITNGIRYLMPNGNNETWGIGSQSHYLAFIDSADVFCNRLMALDNAYVTLNAPLSSGGGVGNSGQVLTSNGSGNIPTWQTVTSLLDVYGYITLNGIHFSGVFDLYKNTSNILELSGNGMQIDGSLNVKSISTNPLTGVPAITSNSSSTICTNINADLLDGHHATDFLTSAFNGGTITNPLTIMSTSEPLLTLNHTNAGILFYNDVNLYRTTKSGLNVLETDFGFIASYINTNQITLNANSGTIPIGVLSTTLCNNLNADYLDGYHASVFLKTSDTITHNTISDWNTATSGFLTNGGDIIVNSVMATTAGGAGLKVGLSNGTTYGALSYDNLYTYVVAYGRDMILATDSGKKVHVSRDLEVFGNINADTNLYLYNGAHIINMTSYFIFDTGTNGEFIWRRDITSGDTSSYVQLALLDGFGNFTLANDLIINGPEVDINPPSSYPVLNLQIASSTKAGFGYDSGNNNTYLTSYSGNLRLASVGGVTTNMNDFVCQGLININTASPVLNLQVNGSTKLDIGYAPNIYGSTSAFINCTSGYLVITTTALSGGEDIVLGPNGTGQVRIWGGRQLLPQNDDHGQVGALGLRFNAGYFHFMNTGDVTFENGWKLTETNNGMALIRKDGSIAQEWA